MTRGLIVLVTAATMGAAILPAPPRQAAMVVPWRPA